jgi:hypothetical protein
MLNLWEQETVSSLYCLLCDITGAIPDKPGMVIKVYPSQFDFEKLTKSVHFLVELIFSFQITNSWNV